jgi:hypothetical protein
VREPCGAVTQRIAGRSTGRAPKVSGHDGISWLVAGRLRPLSCCCHGPGAKDQGNMSYVARLAGAFSGLK